MAKQDPAERKKNKQSPLTGLPTKIILAVLALVLVYQLFTMGNQVKQAREEEQQLAERVEQLKLENAELVADIARANDPDMLEDKARWEQNMVYPDEKVFIDSNSR